jgi:FkbM family methyltransferase
MKFSEELKKIPGLERLGRFIKRQAREFVLGNDVLRPRIGRHFTYVAPIDHFLLDCRRIVHIGANDGTEAFYYDSLGLEVIWIEPIPEIYDKLMINISRYKKQSAIKALLSDTAGKDVILNVSNNNGQSSSIFEFGDHKAAWPEVDYVSKIYCESTTLDLLADNIGPVEAIIVDVQGAELLVFQGGVGVLKDVKYVKSEAANFNCYSGGCTDRDIIDFLEALNFEVISRSTFMINEDIGECFDVTFQKRPLSQTRS